MSAKLKGNTNSYAIYLTFIYTLILLYFFIVDILPVNLGYQVNIIIDVFARVTFSCLMFYLAYILYIKNEKKVITYSVIGYSAVVLISVVCSMVFEFSGANPAFIILGIIGYLATIFLFIQVFRLQKSLFKTYYISLVSVIFTVAMVRVLTPIVIGLIASNISEVRPLMAQVNQIVAIVNLWIPLSIILILIRTQKQIMPSKTEYQGDTDYV